MSGMIIAEAVAPGRAGDRHRPCPTCVALRRQSLGPDAGPASAMLAAAGCGCQSLPRQVAWQRLITPGLGPLARVETLRIGPFGLWVAVARGGDPRPFGAAADTTLGLGIGASDTQARARAIGEVLERYGAAIVPAGVPARVPARWADGTLAGLVDPARVWLPFHRNGQPVLPAHSDGLAFGTTLALAQRSARREWTERRALADLRQAGPGRAGPVSAPPGPVPNARAFSLRASDPVALVLLPPPDNPRGAPVAAGAACRSTLGAALDAALNEALLGWLIAVGAVLPGAGLAATDLLGPLARLRLDDWQTDAPAAPAMPADAAVPAFVDLTPDDIRRAGGHVLRAILPEG